MELWVSMGFTIEWEPSYQRENIKYVTSEWGGNDYYYDGFGKWMIKKPNRRNSGEDEFPVMNADDMLHEICHWICASEAERNVRNFNLDGSPEIGIDKMENRVIQMEQSMRTMAKAAARAAGIVIKDEKQK
jgi:hypothetical protein